jgi:hypothetical protein
METLNKSVAVAPFKKDTGPAERAKGLDLTDVTATRLIETEVMFDSEKFKKGDILYFRSDALRWPPSNQKLKLGDITFILLPEDAPVFVKRASKARIKNGRSPALPIQMELPSGSAHE